MLFVVSAKLIYFFNIRFEKIRKEYIEILLSIFGIKSVYLHHEKTK